MYYIRKIGEHWCVVDSNGTILCYEKDYMSAQRYLNNLKK